jgi:glycosyltransferase involved in cell wall biosynthesis
LRTGANSLCGGRGEQVVTRVSEGACGVAAFDKVKRTWIFRILRDRQVLQAVLRSIIRLRDVIWPLRPGATVVIVNWNGSPFLEQTLPAVVAMSPEGTRLLVVDNHSTDGVRDVVRQVPGARLLRLPVNFGHGAALDIGFLLARTQYVVALDVDAFPMHPSWIDVLVSALDKGAVVAGGRMGTPPFAHPCYLALRHEEYVRRKSTFVPRYREGGWDVGELISRQAAGRVALIAPTEVRGPGPVGTVFGAVVYHNFYGTRHLREADPHGARLDHGVGRDDAMTAWDDAIRRHYPELG